MNLLKSKLTELNDQSRSQLMKEWKRRFGTLAPEHSREVFLKQAIAWQMQVEQWEQQQPENSIKRMHKLLHRKLSETSSSSSPNKTLALTQGTQMVREWNGNTYRVTATNDGYEYAGQVYRSLTAISKLITGTAWSGPKFFGVVK